MQSERLFKQIEFIKEIDKVKYIQRKTRLINSDRNENDAEHSWHLAMMALILLEYSNEAVDLLKVLKMVLIHDIVEIDAGDTFLFETTKNHLNSDEELVAAKRIFGILPNDQATEMIEIWQEFELGETKEAKFAKAIDRFEPILQNTSNNGGTWAEFKVKFETVRQKLKSIANSSKTIWDFSENLLNEAKENGVFDA
ncbi:MAG TPA: HD domain-containing protein [Pyrinomonadaceae bacterium]|nr:HD domain-containing protein [Pyrinomonadaceae bacterium]